MNSTHADLDARRYPTARVGGLFLLLIGLVMLTAALLGGDKGMRMDVFLIGFSIAAAIAFGFMHGKLSFGATSKLQDRVIRGAIFLEVVLLIMVFALLGTNNIRALELWILLAVAIHFLPFVLVHGKLTGIMGALCAISAMLGLLVPEIPLLYLGIADGALKAVFGAALLRSEGR